MNWYNDGAEYSGPITNTMPPTPARLYSDAGVVAFRSTDGMDAQRFWSKVDKSGECWVWTGHRSRKGYGRVKVDSEEWRTHRLSWMLTNGPIPDGALILHHCDNPPCVRPVHLYAGTAKENTADLRARGKPGRHRALTPDQARVIRERHAAGRSARQLARDFGIASSTSQDVVSGRGGYADV